jgi:hypothetical protein
MMPPSENTFGKRYILTHKFFCLVAQPFQAVRKSLAQVENLCHQKLVESTTSPLVGKDKPPRGEGVFAATGFRLRRSRLKIHGWCYGRPRK